jgi:hypothetical protein
LHIDNILSTASVAYFVGIVLVACHIVPSLIEGDKAGRVVSLAAAVVQNIPDYMAD